VPSVMEERRTPLRTGTAKAAFLAALSAALLLVPTFWFIGVLHFGLITGIDPTTGRIVSYIVWTSILGVLLFAYILRRYVRRLGSRHLGFGRACVVAAVALAPMQAATWHVTRNQRWDDELVVLAALALALTAVVVLTEWLSETTPAETAGA
jgi:hypothetical protein